MTDENRPFPADPADEFAETVAGPAPTTGGGMVGARRTVATAVTSVEGASLEATLSAVASARTGRLEANGSAVGLAMVSEDAHVGTSAVGVMTAKGSGSVRQSFVQSFVAGDTVDMQQAAAGAVMARRVTFDQSGSLITFSGDAEVRGGVVGVLLSPRANVSENARVLLTGRALAVLALALFGGLGLVALAVYWGATQIAAKLPRIDWRGFKRRLR